MTIQSVRVNDLRPHPQNYNLHSDMQIQELTKSLKNFSQYKNIVVSRGVILAGHGLVEAAKRAGMETIDAVVLDDLTDDQQKAILLADNALSALATIDADLVNALLEDVGDIEIPGVTPGLIESWLRDVDARDTVNLLADDEEDDDGERDSSSSQASSGGQMPVALIFTREEYDHWQTVKARLGAKTDTQAALRLMSAFEE